MRESICNFNSSSFLTSSPHHPTKTFLIIKVCYNEQQHNDHRSEDEVFSSSSFLSLTTPFIHHHPTSEDENEDHFEEQEEISDKSSATFTSSWRRISCPIGGIIRSKRGNNLSISLLQSSSTDQKDDIIQDSSPLFLLNQLSLSDLDNHPNYNDHEVEEEKNSCEDNEEEDKEDEDGTNCSWFISSIVLPPFYSRYLSTKRPSRKRKLLKPS